MEESKIVLKVSIEAPVYSNLVSSFEYIENCNRYTTF